MTTKFGFATRNSLSLSTWNYLENARVGIIHKNNVGIFLNNAGSLQFWALRALQDAKPKHTKYGFILDVWLPNWLAILSHQKDGLDYAETFSNWIGDWWNQKEGRLESQESDAEATPVDRTCYPHIGIILTKLVETLQCQRNEIAELFAGIAEHVV